MTGPVAATGPPRRFRGRVQRATGGTLLRHSGFRWLWLGQTVSVFGSQVTVLALPLAAVLVLHASTFQVGLLTTAEYAAFLVIGLPAGVWVDRMRRRPIMITADVLRAVTLASVPVAYALGFLTLGQLYVIALIQGEGLRFVATEPVLRMIAGATSTANLFSAAFSAISVVFLVRQIGLGASTIGILSSAAAIGGVAGAFSATWLRRRAGSARIIWVSMTVCAPCALLIPLTSPGPGLLFYAAGLFMTSFGIIVYNVNQASFRQLLCPPRLLGRMNATMRFIVWGTLPLGGLLGGTLGTWLGNRNALWVAAAGTALSPIWLLASPLRRMRDIPTAGTEPARRTSTGTDQPAVP